MKRLSIRIFLPLFLVFVTFYSWGWIARITEAGSGINQQIIDGWYLILSIGLQLETVLSRFFGNGTLEVWYHPTVAIITASFVSTMLLLPFVLTAVVWLRPTQADRPNGDATKNL